MTNQDEVREEFKKFLPNAYTDNSDQEYFTFTADYISDWWLAKFDTILAKKRDTILTFLEETSGKNGRQDIANFINSILS